MWYRSNVFITCPFFWICNILMVFLIVLYVCCVSSMCCAYFELGLLLRIAWICSLYLVLKFLPVCPTYWSGQSLQLSKYMPLLLYISVLGFRGCTGVVQPLIPRDWKSSNRSLRPFLLILSFRRAITVMHASGRLNLHDCRKRFHLYAPFLIKVQVGLKFCPLLETVVFDFLLYISETRLCSVSAALST
jgi:uncharacterized membrane protein YwzB